MASKYRTLIACRTRFLMKSSLGFDLASVPSVRKIVSKTSLTRSSNASCPFALRLPVSVFPEALDKKQLSQFVESFETDQYLPSIVLDEETRSDKKRGKWEEAVSNLEFSLPREGFVHNCLDGKHLLLPVLRRRSSPYEYRRSGLFPEEERLNVVVEFSSPNIAKPFHAGHLRSTILGNFCANIHQSVGHKVTRLNWLGDWGTQFGLLVAGLEKFGTDIDDLRVNAIPKLYKIYVAANSEATNDPNFGKRALELFADLERGDEKLLHLWQQIRQFTVDELTSTYARLNIRFDEYHGEAMYSKDSLRIIDDLRDKGLVTTLPDGPNVIDLDEKRRVIIQKSDGSTLYITRDLAAAIDRKKRYDFHRMLYVVENGQSEHFSNLFGLLQKLGVPWHADLKHVKFGRIHGMSTRKGTAVFLQDILDEAKERMLEQQKKSPNTRATDDVAADILATTAVLVNDMKQRRKRDYEFDWNKALTSTGDSGVKLQYTHSRITSLLRASYHGISQEDLLLEENHECVSELVEPSALALIFQIARFEEVVRDAYLELEPCVIVVYLFKLCNQTSKALKELPVKTAETTSQAKARLILFAAARACLAEGMELLGLQPLEQM